jgi:hypothetical protein
MQTIFKEAEEENNPVPKSINLGCVPFKGKGA